MTSETSNVVDLSMERNQRKIDAANAAIQEYGRRHPPRCLCCGKDMVLSAYPDHGRTVWYCNALTCF
jgi:hypothetical protein